jgi:ADP-heptose:LPS heptosyltransferase
MKSKNLIITFEIENLINDLTLNNLKEYSNKINCDLEIISPSDVLSHTFFKFNNFLTKYDRILYVSPFVLIRPDTPNLFDVVPIDSLGVFNEGRYVNRDLHMKSAMSFYNEKLAKDWKGKYYNCDVIVFSKQHRGLFKEPSNQIGSEIAPYLNLKIHNTETKVFDLPYHYNRMEFLDSQIGISRLDSYMINYTDAPSQIIRSIVEKDVKQWSEDSPNYEYKQNILIRLSAGLGDQIESEPVARFVRKTYPNANIYLTTHHPRAFKHLEKLGIKVYDYTNWEGVNDAVLVMENNPERINSIDRLTQVLFHPTDFSSISMLRRTIPLDEKQIKMDVEISDVESILNLVKNRGKGKEIIVVHPGKWWPSKTFPKDWWQKVVDLLSEKLSVVLIGKTLSEKQGFLDIECPKDGFDFRDFTTFGENIALVSLAKVTLSNDSSPIHIAGAFDNWIVVVPTSKHPDHILPWRNGSQSYKTKAIYKKLLIEDLEVRHTEFYFDTIDKLPKGKTINEYLPEPEEVVNEIFDIYFNKQ